MGAEQTVALGRSCIPRLGAPPPVTQDSRRRHAAWWLSAYQGDHEGTEGLIPGAVSAMPRSTFSSTIVGGSYWSI